VDELWRLEAIDTFGKEHLLGIFKGKEEAKEALQDWNVEYVKACADTENERRMRKRGLPAPVDVERSLISRILDVKAGIVLTPDQLEAARGTAGSGKHRGTTNRWSAYSSGKSRDEVGGKVFYCNVIPDFAVRLELSYVIIITFVIHYYMSGLETDRDVTTLGMPRGDLRLVRGRRDGW